MHLTIDIIRRHLLPTELFDKTWTTRDGDVDDTKLGRLLFNVYRGGDPHHRISPTRSDDRFNRLSQVAKKAHLIRYSKEERKWVLSKGTAASMKALEEECATWTT